MKKSFSEKMLQTCFRRSSFTAKMLMHAHISSRVDYCNYVPYGATFRVTRKLLAY